MFATPAYAKAAGAVPSDGAMRSLFPTIGMIVMLVGAATPTYAQAAGAAAESPIASLLPTVGMVVLFIALMYFTMIRPQQKRQKEHQSMIGALKRGDTVVLSNGMVGKVTRVEEDEAMVEIASGVNTRVIKGMITEVRTRGQPAASDAKS